jgi:hypothetical protein
VRVAKDQLVSCVQGLVEVAASCIDEMAYVVNGLPSLRGKEPILVLTLGESNN